MSEVIDLSTIQDVATDPVRTIVNNPRYSCYGDLGFCSDILNRGQIYDLRYGKRFP